MNGDACSLPFSEAFTNRTSGQQKIPQREYLEAGTLPVVDQGTDLVAGYTDDDCSAYNGPLPVIVFGDHTRVFKYVDFPFALGADGVKVLVPKEAFEPRYLYYLLLAQKLPSRGYSRHFQFLRKTRIRWVPQSEQRRIVEILDQADHLRSLRTEADTMANRILPALFLKLFVRGGSEGRGERLDELVEIGGAVVDPNRSEYLELPHVGGRQIEKGVGRILEMRSVRDSRLRSGKFYFTDRHVLYSKIRPYLNKVAYPRFAGLCSADIYPLLPKNRRIGPWFLAAMLRSGDFLTYARGKSDRLRIPKLNREQLGSYSVPLPNPGALEAFEARAERLARLEKKRLRSGARIESLFRIVLHRGFQGDLTATWRAANMKELVQEMEHQANVVGTG